MKESSKGPFSLIKDPYEKHDFQTWVRKTDAAHSRLIKLMGERCVTCGTTDRSQFTCSHIFKREGYTDRWDYHKGGNCVVQCMLCNQHHEEDTTALYNWYKRAFGETAFEELRTRHFRTRKLTFPEVKEIYEEICQVFNDTIESRQLNLL